MKTEFEYYNLSNELKKANLVISFVLNDKKYIVYEIEDEQNLEYDIMHIGSYEEVDGMPFISDITDEELKLVNQHLAKIMKEYNEQFS